MIHRCLAPLLGVLVFNAPATAQGIAVSGHVGTLGVGADISIGLGRTLALRGGANAQPWEPKREFDNIEYTLELPTPSYTAMVDLWLGGVFHLSGGAVWLSKDTEVRARPTEPVEIGNQTYAPADVGTLSGTFVTRDLAPYAGIGFGKAPGRKGLGLVFDLGVAFQGAPDVQLSASGPLASQPAFQANLLQEEQSIEDDARPYRFYPVISLGLVVAF